MSSRIPALVVAFSFAIAATVSCSGGKAGGGSPLTPELSGPDGSRQVPGLGADAATREYGRTHYLWAYYLLYGDPDTGELEVVPLREAAGHWNILRFLEQGACTDCFKLVGITPVPDEKTYILNVKIKHPFDDPTFTGFDVRGIVMFDGSHTFPVAGLTASSRDAGDGQLMNPDGYTTLYNITTEGCGPNGLQGYQKGELATTIPPGALLNGYKRHISEGDENTRNAFYSGASVVAGYEIAFPKPFVLGYAVDASWALPTTMPVTDPMNDFPPEANCPEPWKIEIEEDVNPICGGLRDTGGNTHLLIDVYDYQGQETHLPPTLECPELYEGALEASLMESGIGYSRWEATVENEKLASVGDYICLVSVWDEADASSPDWLDLTAYHIYDLPVHPTPECIPDENNWWNESTVPNIPFHTSSEIQTVCDPSDKEDWYRFESEGPICGQLLLDVICRDGPCEMTLYTEEQVQTYPDCVYTAQAMADEPDYEGIIELDDLLLGQGQYFVRVRHPEEDGTLRNYEYFNNGGPCEMTIEVTDDITGSEVWGPPWTYWICSRTITITETGNLKILPCTVVKFGPCSGSDKFGLVVDGILEAEGEEGCPIVFTSVKDDDADGEDACGDGPTEPKAGDWSYIFFTENCASSSCMLRHCDIRYGGGYKYTSDRSGVVRCDGASPLINHCQVRYSSTSGIHVAGGSPQISRNYITHCGWYGIRCSGGCASILSNNEVYWSGYTPIAHDLDCPLVWQPNNITDSNAIEGRGLFGTMTIPERALTTGEQAILPYVFVADPLYSSDLTVGDSSDLVVEPGVVLKFAQYKGIQVDGTLECDAGDAESIVFTSIQDDAADGVDVTHNGPIEPGKGDWHRVFFTAASSDDCVIRNCELRYGGRYCGSSSCLRGMVRCDGCSPPIDLCTIESSAYTGIEVYHGAPSITQCRIKDNGYDGIGMDGGSGEVSDCTIDYNAQSGISMAQSSPTITKCVIDYSGTYGICCWAESDPVINLTEVYHSGRTPLAHDLDSYPDWNPSNIHENNACEGRGIFGTLTLPERHLTVAEQEILPYLVVDELGVGSQSKLVIDPGVVVKFAKYDNYGYAVTVNGALECVGEEGNEIILTSVDDDDADGIDLCGDGSTNPQKGQWKYIYFTEDCLSPQCILSRSEFRYGGSYHYSSERSGIIRCQGASPTIEFCTIDHSSTSGIHLVDSSAPVSNCTIKLNDWYGIRCSNGSAPILTENTFKCNGLSPIGYDLDSYPEWQESNEEDVNGFGGRGLFGTMTVPERWLTVEEQTVLPYVVIADPIVTTNLKVGPSSWLMIEPGVVIKCDKYRGVEVDGVLKCEGEEGNEIVFTSAEDDAADGEDIKDNGPIPPNPGDWAYVGFLPSSIDSECIVSHCNFRWGGRASSGLCNLLACTNSSPSIEYCRTEYGAASGIGVNSGIQTISHCYSEHNESCGIALWSASPTITDCFLSTNTLDGINARDGGEPIITECTVENNGRAAIAYDLNTYPYWNPNNTVESNGYDARGLFGTMTECERHLTVEEQTVLPWVILEDLTIGSECCRLEVEPGVVLKFAPEASITVSAHAMLHCVGQAGNEIVFTSVQDDYADDNDVTNNGLTEGSKGDWECIRYLEGSSAQHNRLEYCEIRFGGGYLYGSNYGMIYCDSASPTMEDCWIQSSGYNGIFSRNGAPQVIDCDIGFHDRHGILCSDGSSIFIHLCDIHDNTECGIWIDSDASPILGENEFWNNGQDICYE